MNGELILQIVLVLTPALVSALVGYLLGKRSQKFQIIREYITETVKDEYPALFSEIKRNSQYLDNYLETPDYNFPFPKLHDIFDRGLDRFMERHHKDLFQTVSLFQKKTVAKLRELDLLKRNIIEKLFDSWSVYLKSSLPKEAIGESERIGEDLIKTVGSYYVLPDLLNDRDEEVRKKIEGCILDRTSHIFREKAKRPFVIRGQQKGINFKEISESLIGKAKPEVVNFLQCYKELKTQNDREVKEKLLPLLKKYISNPV